MRRLRLRSTGVFVLCVAAAASCSPGLRQEATAPPDREGAAPPVAAKSAPSQAPRAEGSHASAPSAPSNSVAPPANPAAAAPAEKPAPDGRPRIGSVKPVTYIWPTPDRPKGHLPMGALRYGTSIPLRSSEPVKGGGCRASWYAVEPLGYICADDTTTLDIASPYWKALSSAAPGPGPFPYRYVSSTGTPMYMRVPTPEEQREAERKLGPARTFKPLGKWFRTYERLISTDPNDEIAPTDEIPEALRDHKTIPGSPYHPAAAPNVRFAPAGTALSYSKAFSAAGRTWLLLPDLLLVPADRVFPFTRSTFRGVALGEDKEGDFAKKLPIAWVRGEPAPKLAREADGSFRDTMERWSPKTPVFLTGAEVRVGKTTYCEAREGGRFIEVTEGVSVARAAAALPASIGPDEKWVEAHIMAGTMVAYVGKTPVWATLWSGGRGGVPVKGNNPVDYATTELGIFAIQWKDKTATMSPDPGAPTTLWFSDVPHIQYLHAPMALHVTYWHGDFGYLRSAECLNVSPLDGEWLFGWTSPALPEGWGAVRPGKVMGASTKVVIRP